MLKFLGRHRTPAIRRQLLARGVDKTTLIERRAHDHEDRPPLPFENLPFNFANRYVQTLSMGLFFASGFSLPYFIVWYQMAKGSL